MACKKTTVPFSGTKEQEAALKEAIAQLKDTPGSLMPIMQKAQEIYGYLPIEVQTMISDEQGFRWKRFMECLPSTPSSLYSLRANTKFPSVSVLRAM